MKGGWFSNLILSKTHLNDPFRIPNLIVGILLVFLPPQEVRGILPVRVARSLCRQQPHFWCLCD